MNDTLVAGFLENVGELLSVAIRTGNAEEAASLISRLSTLKLNINISIRKEESEKHSDEQEFSVKVHVEDRISDGCFFNLLVKSSDTIKDLKTKVMLKYNFPVEVQKWIIGKKIPDDGNKLSQCGVKGPGHILYLYLVTARSVGLSRQDHEARRHSQQNEVQGSQDQHSQTLLLLREPNWPADATTVQLLCDHHSPTPTFSPPTVTEDMIGNLYGPARQSSKRSLSSGSSFLYDMVMDPNQPSGVSIVKNSQNSVCESGGNEQKDTRISPPRPISVLGVRTSTTPPPNHEKLHWQCPMCTYLNLPMRPGCEMCSSSRPLDYKIPPGYQVTAEERLLLENDQRLERMTREAGPRPQMIARAPPNEDGGNLVLNMTDLLGSSNSGTCHRHSSPRNQIMGSDYNLCPDGSDWDNMQEWTVTVGHANSPKLQLVSQSPVNFPYSAHASNSKSVGPQTGSQFLPTPVATQQDFWEEDFSLADEDP